MVVSQECAHCIAIGIEYKFSAAAKICSCDQCINDHQSLIGGVMIHLVERRSSAPASHPWNALPLVLLCQRLKQLVMALRLLDSTWLR